MKKAKLFKLMLTLFLVFLMAAPPWVVSQGTQATEEAKTFKQEELDQMLAPIALYPDDLLMQVLIAATYPLEIVQAARWTKQNKDLKGDKLTEALEKQDWDPSVKSLVNFPDVLEKMNEKLEWTQKVGDALLAQEKEVMDTIQNLRKKAQQAGNLKDTEQQKVVVEKETQTIVIQPTNPEVIYAPSYNPAVVYGAWWWPAFPPFPGFFLPPPGMLFGAGMRFAAGAAWGYAWGHANWGGGNVNINANRNTNINNNINRDKYKNDMKNRGMGEGGQGRFQHDASHRKGVSYRDQQTGQKFNKASTREASQGRESFRGRGDQGRQDPSRGGGDRGSFDRGGRGGESVSQRGSRDSAFGGSQRGSEARQQSSRGSSSRASSSSRGSSGGGGSRGGGGGSRGGGGGGRR